MTNTYIHSISGCEIIVTEKTVVHLYAAQEGRALVYSNTTRGGEGTGTPRDNARSYLYQLVKNDPEMVEALHVRGAIDVSSKVAAR